jgi:hypothetical protein
MELWMMAKSVAVKSERCPETVPLGPGDPVVDIDSERKVDNKRDAGRNIDAEFHVSSAGGMKGSPSGILKCQWKRPH